MQRDQRMFPKSAAVLYVEDDESDSYFMERAFEAAGEGMVLRTVPDGEAAVAYLSGTGAYADRGRHPLPQVVLLDLNLPRLSGFEVLEWIRRHPQHGPLPVVIFSSSSRSEDRARAAALGANAYWEKPNSGLHFVRLVSALRQGGMTGLPAGVAEECPPKDAESRPN